jgi:hypothetical protein
MSDSIEEAAILQERPRSAGPEVREQGAGISTVLLLLAWPLLVVAAGGYWLDQRHAQQTAAALADRPRVVVLSESDFIRKAKPAGTPDATVAAGLREADATASKLAAAGYIVIKKSAIVSAPVDANVTPP